MNAGASARKSDEFIASTELRLSSLLSKLALDRYTQCLEWHVKLMEHDKFIGSSIGDFYPHIEWLACRESLFIINPSFDENGDLERDWTDLHARMIENLTNAGHDLSWDGMRRQIQHVDMIGWAHRGSWVREWLKMEPLLQVCDAYIANDEMDKALAVRTSLLKVLEGAASTMINDSGLNKTLVCN